MGDQPSTGERPETVSAIILRKATTVSNVDGINGCLPLWKAEYCLFRKVSLVPYADVGISYIILLVSRVGGPTRQMN